MNFNKHLIFFNIEVTELYVIHIWYVKKQETLIPYSCSFMLYFGLTLSMDGACPLGFTNGVLGRADTGSITKAL